MKVKLLKDLGIHKAGTILDVDSTIVLQLEKDGNATMNLDIEVETTEIEKIEEVIETKEVEEVVDEQVETTAKVYTDSTGKTYTEEEFSKIDKRTALYKEIINLSK